MVFQSVRHAVIFFATLELISNGMEARGGNFALAFSSPTYAFQPKTITFPSSRESRKYVSSYSSTSPTTNTNTALFMSTPPSIITTKLVRNAAIALAIAGTAGAKMILDRPSRTYGDGTVAKEYDSWTSDGILEYYWGEHIHLGYYNKKE